jgi:2-keto-4-pentenoate hydratase/2-oxohepta-3-ene-1,7-dioic acid hydratase in catechol pathway
MRLVSFEIDSGSRQIGALLDDGRTIANLTIMGAPHFRDMLALIDGGEAALEEARAVTRAPKATIALSSVRLLAPIPVPRQMRDFNAFERHLRQARANRYLILGSDRVSPEQIEIPKVWYDQPLYYKCNRFSVIGPDAVVIRPKYSRLLDYELELAVVIGRKGKDIKRDDARAHIFGYTIFNDFSARDAQIREMQGQLGPAKGKDFDTGNALGPWLVTADEIPNPYDLDMVARVNGEEWSRGNSGTLYHRIEDMIAHLSADETIYPGEVIGCGTVGGGCGLELGRFLEPGDVIELEISGLGVLRNRVTSL